MVKEGKEKKSKKSKRNDGEISGEKAEAAGYQMPQMMMAMPGAMPPSMPGAMNPQMAMMMGMRGMPMGPRAGMPPMMMPTMQMPPQFPTGAPFAPRGGALAVGHARRSKRPEMSSPMPSEPAAVTVVESDASNSSSSSSSDSSSSSSSSANKAENGQQQERSAQKEEGVHVAGHTVPATIPGTDQPQEVIAPVQESAPQEAPAPAQESAPVVHAPAPAISKEAAPTQLKKPKPKLGKISFNIQGGSIAAAQAKTQVEEAIAAERARRLNTKDASTQTVRDPENDGEIVTIWRLRPRGMESFPHFPKATKKKAREQKICAAADEEQPEDNDEGIPQPEKKLKISLDGMAKVDGDIPVQVESSAGDHSTQKQLSVDESEEEESPADDVLQSALAQSVQVHV